MESIGYMHKVGDGSKFEVKCTAGESGALRAGAESLSIQVGQLVLRDGAKEIWRSVGVFANEDEDGDLVIRVLICNPDWDEALQIARITSRPHDPGCRTPLGCNLDHKTG